MRTYWNNLNERERVLLVAGTVCLLIFVFYQFLYSPLLSHVAESKKILQEKKATLAWMEEVQRKAQNNTRKSPINASKLLSLIATQLKGPEFAKFPHQIQQTTQGSIELSFEKVPYHAFLNWLWSLVNAYSLMLKQVDITSTEVPGVVKVTIRMDANA